MKQSDMPDYIYADELLKSGLVMSCSEPFSSCQHKYISDKKHQAEIEALNAEHAKQMVELCDEIENTMPLIISNKSDLTDNEIRHQSLLNKINLGISKYLSSIRKRLEVKGE